MDRLSPSPLGICRWRQAQSPSPGKITVVKQASPEGSTSFPFTDTGGLTPSSFNLVDDGTATNTHLFDNITTFTTYGFTENTPSGWNLDSRGCVVDPSTDNGGTTSNSGASTASIVMKEGEFWTCTYNNSLQAGTLIVKKFVTNNDGGTAVPSNWSIHVKSSGSDVSGSPQAGDDTTGTSYTLAPGGYVASETGGPSGYTGPTFGGDCDSSGNVTVVDGQTKTCTLTNTDNTPS